jgi:hypothetical protein
MNKSHADKLNEVLALACLSFVRNATVLNQALVFLMMHERAEDSD